MEGTQWPSDFDNWIWWVGSPILGREISIIHSYLWLPQNITGLELDDKMIVWTVGGTLL